MSATPRFDPLQRPGGGSWYVYKWLETSRKDDWQADGFRWRQCGSMKINCRACTFTYVITMTITAH